MRIFLGGLGLGVHWVGWCNMVIRLSPQRPGPNPASRNRPLIKLPQSGSNQEGQKEKQGHILLKHCQIRAWGIELSLQLSLVQIQFHFW